MDLKLKGKKAVICAASKGLGKAVAEELAKEGCHLYLCSRSPEPLAATAAELKQRFPESDIFYQACDLSEAKGVEDFLAAVQRQWPITDILLNNIGGPAPSSARGTTAQQWRQGFEQIFMSAQGMIAGLLPAMLEQKFGRILTITSLSVVEPIPHLAVSTAMRAAVTAFQKNLATEVAPDNVSVHTIMPGIIHTARIEDLRRARADRQGTTFEEEMAKTKQEQPSGRLGEPEELAKLVCFLASPVASYLNGLNLAVDGGQRKGWT